MCLACTALQHQSPRPGIIDTVNQPLVDHTLCWGIWFRQTNPDKYIRHLSPKTGRNIPSYSDAIEVRFVAPGCTIFLIRLSMKPDLNRSSGKRLSPNTSTDLFTKPIKKAGRISKRNSPAPRRGVSAKPIAGPSKPYGALVQRISSISTRPLPLF